MSQDDSDLLAAESALAVVTKQMADDFQAHGRCWPRGWMQKHIEDRNSLIKARNILLDKVEMSGLKNSDLGERLGFVEWLKAQGMYNPMESAHTMRKMHRVWNVASGRAPEDIGGEA